MSRTLDDLLIPVQTNRVYTLRELSRALCLSLNILREAIRAGKLRHTERDGRRLVRGEWVVRWIATAETEERPRHWKSK